MVETEGVVQEPIILGSIYECGRAGEPDHAKALVQHAKVLIRFAKALVQHAKAFIQHEKVAAICDAPEVLYKLGDMCGRT